MEFTISFSDSQIYCFGVAKVWMLSTWQGKCDLLATFQISTVAKLFCAA